MSSLLVVCTFMDADATTACSPAVLTRVARCPVMRMVSHYELHDDELALWHSSPRIIVESKSVMNSLPTVTTISCGVLPLCHGDV